MVYEMDGAGGLRLVRDGKTVLTIPADGELALLYERDDAVGGTLLKHGEAGDVRREHARHREAFSRGAGDAHRAGLARGREDEDGLVDLLLGMADGLEVVAVPVAAVTEDVLEEINACLAISGRVGGLPDRLGALADARRGGPGR